MAPLIGSAFCFAHDPERASSRALARRRGGRRRQAAARTGRTIAPAQLDTASNIQQLLESVLNDTLSQRNSLQRSRTICYLIGYALKVLEVGQFEERISALEQRLALRGDSTQKT